jgi:hypothetical protein
MVLVLNRKWEYIGGGGEVEGGVEEKEIVEGVCSNSHLSLGGIVV